MREERTKRKKPKRTNHTRRSIPNLVILTLTQLDEELGNLVLDLHLRHDGRAVVSDGDVAVGGDEDLVETCGGAGGEDGRAQGGRNRRGVSVGGNEKDWEVEE